MIDPTIDSPAFDWQSGRISFPVSEGKTQAQEWSLVVCGDWALAPTSRQALLSTPSNLYGDLLPIIRDADLAVVNLEGVITDDGLQPIVKDGIAIQIPTDAITALSGVPFHLACLANNHAFDFGVEGFEKTKDLLENHNIQHIGAGLCTDKATEAVFFQFAQVDQVDQVRLAVVNVAEGEEGRSTADGPGVAPLDLPRLQEQLAALRTQADVVMVVVHAGREYLPVPAPYIQAMYRSLVDAGADLVVGHHPHVPQGLELYRDKPIVYSLGNFAFFLDTPDEHCSVGYFLKARFQGSSLVALEIWPYEIGQDGLDLLTGARLTDFMSELEQSSSIIAGDGRVTDVWHAYADHWLLSVGMQELADSVALIGGEAVMTQAALKVALGRFSGNNLVHRFARRSIWWAINWLNQRVSANQSSEARAQRGASILRNRFDTLAHRELYLTALRRVMDGDLGRAPTWAKEALRDWNVFWTDNYE